MAIIYHFDLYPRDHPRDGDRIVRFTTMQMAEYRGEAFGTGAGKFSVRALRADGLEFEGTGGNEYVRVVEENTTLDEETVVGGFWIDYFDVSLLDENMTTLLEASGAGTLAYLDRAVMWSRTYTRTDDPLVPDDEWLFGEVFDLTTLGAGLHKTIQEAKSFNDPAIHADDRTTDALQSLEMDFDSAEDSSGNPWTLPIGDMSAQVGENVAQVVKRFMEAGLYVEIDPDTFILSAWEADNHGRDRTGTSWGTNVVRFHSDWSGITDPGSQAGTNILSQLTRGISAKRKLSVLLSGGEGLYQDARQAHAIEREGFFDFQADTRDEINDVAEQQIAAQNEAGDTALLRFRLGNAPTEGYYLPFRHVRLDDQVTLDMDGVDNWGYTDDPFPVAALTIKVKAGGDWEAWADLGSTFQSLSGRAFQAQPVRRHRHSPNPRLCRPTVAPGAPGGGTELLNELWDYTADNLSSPGAYSWSVRDPDPDGSGLDGSAPVGTASSVYRYSQRMPCSANSTLSVSGSICRAVGGFSGGFDIALSHRVYWYTSLGATTHFQSDTLGSVVATGDSASSFDYAIIVPAGATYFSVRQDRISHQDNVRVIVTDDDSTPGTPGTGGGGHLDLVGSSVFAKRCDATDTVFRTTSPGPTDDVEHGYPVHTTWMLVDDEDNPTQVFGIWHLLQDDNGAAVWFQWWPLDSANVPYDNTDSGLTSDNVQDALDELAAGAGADTELDDRVSALEALPAVLSYSEAIGDGSATSFNVTHGLGTTDVQVQAYDLSGSLPEMVGIIVTVVDDDTIAVDTSPTIMGTTALRVVVHGAPGASSGGGGGPGPGDFAPTDISDLGLWLDADDGSTFTFGTGTAVATWADKSGSGRNMTQATTANQPTRTAANINGRASVTFDGTNDRVSLASGNLDLLRNLSGASLFVVNRVDNTSAVKTLFWASVGGSNNSRARLQKGAAAAYEIGGRRLDGDSVDDMATPPTYSAGVVVIDQVDYDWADSAIYHYLDGTLNDSDTGWLTNGSTSDTDSQFLSVGRGSVGGSPDEFMDGDICEVLVYRRVVTSDERDDIVTYLTDKWLGGNDVSVTSLWVGGIEDE